MFNFQPCSIQAIDLISGKEIKFLNIGQVQWVYYRPCICMKTFKMTHNYNPVLLKGHTGVWTAREHLQAGWILRCYTMHSELTTIFNTEVGWRPFPAQCALIRTWSKHQNVGGDLHIAVSTLRTVYWSLREAADFLGGVHSKSNVSLVPEKIYSSISPSGARRLAAR